MDTVKSYEIGGKKYVQRPIVLGQLELLAPLLANLELRELNAAELLRVVGAKLPELLAILVVEKGAVRAAFEEQQLGGRIDELRWTVDAEMAMQVIEDFFVCNPVSSISAKVSEALGKLTRVAAETGSSESTSSSAGETSADASSSAGDQPQQQP